MKRFFVSPKLRPLLLLFFIAAFYFLLGIHKIIPLRPQSVHQWAQCDRASVAWNYYNSGYHFFYPAVNNIDNGSGVTGMEFPIVQFIVSLLYGLFGFHEWFYRLITLIVYTFGLYSAFHISKYFTSNALSAIGIVLLFACSPVLVFYSVSFIPDIYSMSLMLIAWYLLIVQVNGKHKYAPVLHWIFILIACLIKPTALIHIPPMLLFRKMVLERDRGIKAMLPSLLFTVLVFFLTFLWYAYASWLSKSEHSEIFLLQSRPLQNWTQFVEVWEIVKKDWLDRIFHPFILLAICFLCGFFLLRKFDRKDPLSCLLVMNLLGMLAFIRQMWLQFAFHDYYSVVLMPVFLFMLIYCFRSVLQLRKKQIAYFFSALLLISSAFQFYLAKTHLRVSHKKDNWKYGSVHFDACFDGAAFLTKSGIPAGAAIITLFDHTPNVSLYLLGRRGVSVSYHHTSDEIMSYLNRGDLRYLLFNEQSTFEQYSFNPGTYPIHEIYSEYPFRLYEVNHNFRPTLISKAMSPWN